MLHIYNHLFTVQLSRETLALPNTYQPKKKHKNHTVAESMFSNDLIPLISLRGYKLSNTHSILHSVAFLPLAHYYVNQHQCWMQTGGSTLFMVALRRNSIDWLLLLLSEYTVARITNFSWQTINAKR